MVGCVMVGYGYGCLLWVERCDQAPHKWVNGVGYSKNGYSKNLLYIACEEDVGSLHKILNIAYIYT